MTPFANPLKAALMFALVLLLLLGLTAGISRLSDNAAQSASEARQSRAEGGAVVESIKDQNRAQAQSGAKFEGIDAQVKEAGHEIDQASNVSDITRIGAERLRAHRDRAGKP